MRTDHVELACETVPGAGRDHQWFVTISGQLSEAATTSYAPPTLEVYLDYELVMHTEVWLRPQSEAGGRTGRSACPSYPPALMQTARAPT